MQKQVIACEPRPRGVSRVCSRVEQEFYVLICGLRQYGDECKISRKLTQTEQDNMRKLKKIELWCLPPNSILPEDRWVQDFLAFIAKPGNFTKAKITFAKLFERWIAIRLPAQTSTETRKHFQNAQAWYRGKWRKIESDLLQCMVGEFPFRVTVHEVVNPLARKPFAQSAFGQPHRNVTDDDTNLTGIYVAQLHSAFTTIGATARTMDHHTALMRNATSHVSKLKNAATVTELISGFNLLHDCATQIANFLSSAVSNFNSIIAVNWETAARTESSSSTRPIGTRGSGMLAVQDLCGTNNERYLPQYPNFVWRGPQSRSRLSISSLCHDSMQIPPVSNTNLVWRTPATKNRVSPY